MCSPLGLQVCVRDRHHVFSWKNAQVNSRIRLEGHQIILLKCFVSLEQPPEMMANTDERGVPLHYT